MGHDNSKTIEKVRPILQAMERSIDAARSRRIVDDAAPETPAPTARPETPVRPLAAPPAAPTQPAMVSDGTTPRLKARPKRSVPLIEDQHGYRSRAS